MPDSPVVLIAEDNRSIAIVVAMVVEDAGGTPLIAYDGREALELAHSAAVVLVITDLMMPILGGLGLIRALREDALTGGRPMPPVILMTAASPDHAREVEADVVLPKPFDLVELDTLLHRYLG